MTSRLALAILSVSLPFGHVSAAVLALYDFESGTDPLSHASVDTDLDSTASNFVDQSTGNSSTFLGSATGTSIVNFVTEDLDGSGAGTSTSRGLGVAMQREYVSGVSAGSAASGFTAANTWHEFTVAPVSGGTISLTTLTFDTSYFSSLAGSVTDAQYVVSVNTGSGFTSLPTLTSTSGLTTTGDTAYESISVDLSGITLGLGQSVSFRLDAQATGANNGSITQRRYTYDNITLNGSVNVVPEPSAALLGGLGLLALLRRRRDA